MSDQPENNTLLDIALASYRDMFGTKTERGNEIHRAACAEVARLRESETSLAITSSLLEERERQLDEAAEIFERLNNWAKAYPLDVFPEPNLKQAHALLEAGGMTLDAVSASAMRHLLTTVQEMTGKVKHE